MYNLFFFILRNSREKIESKTLLPLFMRDKLEELKERSFFLNLIAFSRGFRFASDPTKNKKELLLRIKYSYISGEANFSDYIEISILNQFLWGLRYCVLQDAVIDQFGVRSPWENLLWSSPKWKVSSTEIIRIIKYLKFLDPNDRFNFSYYKENLLYKFIKEGNLELVKYLISIGVSINIRSDKDFRWVLKTYSFSLDLKLKLEKYGFYLSFSESQFHTGDEFYFLEGNDIDKAKLLQELNNNLIPFPLWYFDASSLDIAYIYNQQEILDYLKKI